MNPSFTRRARVAYYLAWLPMAALVAVVLNLRGHPWWESLAVTLPLSVLYALVCGSSYYMARAMPLRRTRLVPVVLSLVAASTIAGIAWAGLAYALARSLPDPAGSRLANQLWILLGIGTGYFVLSLVYHYLILAMEEARRAEHQADEAKVLTRDAELRALRAQINPHFLFNSLNSIAALTTVDPEQARRMCQLLSEFFRTTLRLGDREGVSLKEELSLIRCYLDIEQVRFGDRMSFREQIDKRCLEKIFPPLLLQPLVENAVKHGVASLVEGGQIVLEARLDGERLTVAVENPIDPDRLTRPGSGKGLRIVEERLRSFFGDAARMVVNQSQERFRVELRVPASR
jgi:hypothetical protein